MADSIQMIAENRKARHEYFILETWECGIQLQGTEVKSLRQGAGSFKDSFVQVRMGELWILGLHIAPYEMGNRFNHQPERPRRLLAHRSEIRKMHQKVQQDGLSLIPLKLYWKAGLVKLEIALGRGKKLYDKRQTEADRDVSRKIQKMLKYEVRHDD